MLSCDEAWFTGSAELAGIGTRLPGGPESTGHGRKMKILKWELEPCDTPRIPVLLTSNKAIATRVEAITSKNMARSVGRTSAAWARTRQSTSELVYTINLDHPAMSHGS